jgi:hypothetical protein
MLVLAAADSEPRLQGAFFEKAEYYGLWISARMSRGVPGPPGENRTAIARNKINATNARSGFGTQPPLFRQ